MLGMLRGQIEFRSKHRKILQATTIDEDQPGTILRDFAAFLAYFRERRRSLTGNQQLKLKDLAALNARLVHPIVLGLKRPQQKSYPHINGLYLLLRASGLTWVDRAGKTPVLVVDEALYDVWRALNPTERYCALLETWLLRGRPQIIGEHAAAWRIIPETIGGWGRIFLQIPDAGMDVAGNQAADERVRFSLGWHNLGLLELFGVMDVYHGVSKPGEGWQVERIVRTPLGDALLGSLLTGFFNDFDNILALEQEGTIPMGVLQPVLQPYFPAWQNVVHLPEAVFREGVFVFKVSLWKDVWRRFAIPAEKTLDDLAYAIRNSVGFDSDHLEQFSYQNRYGVWEHVNHPYMDEGPWTDEVRVGDVPLGVGQVMEYLFDFGDNWKFTLALERVDLPDTALQEAVILEAHGEPPEQYPTLEGDDW